MQVLGAQPGRSLGVGFQHHHPHAQRQGGQGQHLRQLSAAQNAQRPLSHIPPAWG